VVLVRYSDLSRDLEGQMRRLADLLGFTVPEPVWPELVQAATFERMRCDADRFVPAGGILKSSADFFRRGRPGAAREVLTEAEIDRYRSRAASLAPPGLLSWLHAPGSDSPSAGPAG
jgi:hypothetical protein